MKPREPSAVGSRGRSAFVPALPWLWRVAVGAGRGKAALTACFALSGSFFPHPSNGSPNHQPEPPPPIADVSHTPELMLVVRMARRSESGLRGRRWGGRASRGKRLIWFNASGQLYPLLEAMG